MAEVLRIDGERRMMVEEEITREVIRIQIDMSEFVNKQLLR
jgi:hypothetical protein